jgi:hypothetical protein
MRKFLVIFPLIFFLQGCSWITPFYIVNLTDSEIGIEVGLVDLAHGIPIFQNANTSFRQLALTKNGFPDETKSMDAKAEALESPYHYRIKLPPHSAIMIGSLQNDKYYSYDQKFINDRVFNLKRIVITKGNQVQTEIDGPVFDNFFLSIQNKIIYEVKP